MSDKRESKVELHDSDEMRAAGDSHDESSAQTGAETSPDMNTASGRPAPEPAAADPEAVPELSEESRLAARVAELEDRLLRSMADFDNYKKRSARQYEEIIATANDRLLTELLEVVDNFERAFDHADQDREPDALLQGAKLIYGQLRDLLARYNVTPIEAVGRIFDPNFHEAVMQVDSEEYEEGIVAIEMSRGWRRGERILRHSKVAVSRGPAASG